MRDDLVEGDLLVQQDRISAVGRISAPPGVLERDLAGYLISPGLIDLQVNGAMGVEVYDGSPRALATVSLAAPPHGCTAILPTMISALEPSYYALFNALRSAAPVDGARILGLHLEGPFINPPYKGAHPESAIRLPNVDEVRRILTAAEGAVRLWTLAPELPASGSTIELLVEEDVVVAAGHTGLTAHDATSWFDDGIGLVTHLFNSMSPLHHREPGIPGAVFDHPTVLFSLIVDGQHVHPAVVRLAWKLARDRLVLITDAAACAGAPDGTYKFGDREVICHDGLPRLPDGTLAGSGLTPLEAVLNLVSFTGCSLPTAITAMTERPAQLLGLSDMGRLEEGMLADFLILEPDGRLHETWIDGRLVYAAGPAEAAPEASQRYTRTGA
jgi:N-acetylglucosamine-6-phosphate deacetylase